MGSTAQQGSWGTDTAVRPFGSETLDTMKLIVLHNCSQANEWAAKHIRNHITQFNPGPDKTFTLGLPIGRTPLGCYKKLTESYKNGDLSFKYVKTFNMDEYVAFLETTQSTAPSRGTTSSSTLTSIQKTPIFWMGMQQTWRWSVTALKRRSQLVGDRAVLLEALAPMDTLPSRNQVPFWSPGPV